MSWSKHLKCILVLALNTYASITISNFGVMRSEISLQLCKCKNATPHILSRLHLQLSSRLLFKPQSLNHNKLQENLVSEWSTVLEMQSTGTMLFGPAYTNSPIHHGPSQLLLFIVSWAQCSAAVLTEYVFVKHGSAASWNMDGVGSVRHVAKRRHFLSSVI